MSADVQADLNHIHGVSAAVTGSLKFAQVNSVLGDKLHQLPGLDAVVQDVVAHAEAATKAITKIVAAVDLAAASAGVQAGAASKSPIDDAALKAGIAELGQAVAIGPLVGKIEALLGNPAVKAGVKAATAKRGLSGGIAEVRGALKSVTPGTVAVSGHISKIIQDIKKAEALASSPAAKQSLEQAETTLTGVLTGLNANILRFVSVVDTAVGAIFS